MKVAFRTDASFTIGSGHIMRCLTLADALTAQGAECHFITRAHPGNLLELIRQRGFEVTAFPVGLPMPSTNTRLVREHSKESFHASWLGCDWQFDAEQTRAVLVKFEPDWLVVDHYALDQRWETKLRPHSQKLMVLDDLADRQHQCDLLINQNLGRLPKDYTFLVPAKCKVLTGPQYALLRPEFAALRAYSLQRRQQPVLKKVLISMGGVDQANATCQVLEALENSSLPEDCRISVVMGQQALWLQQVRAKAQAMPWSTEVLVNIQDMARRMADSDLAIGAAGSTSWERCCLGVPTLQVVLADNQRLGALALQEKHAAYLIGDVKDISINLPLAINESTSNFWMQKTSNATALITDGRGVEKVLKAIRVLND